MEVKDKKFENIDSINLGKSNKFMIIYDMKYAHFLYFVQYKRN